MSPTRSRLSRSKVYKTRLIVGEGSKEKSFLEHIKNIYHSRELGFDIIIRNSTGGSPENVIKNTITRKKNAAYNNTYVLLDTDCEWPGSLIKKANEHNIELIGSSPICLEGLLLKIKRIELPPCHTSQACKSKIGNALSGTPFSQSFLNNHFDRQTLDSASQNIECLKQIINIFSVL